MPRFFFLLTFFCLASLLNAQEKPSISFAPTEVHRFRDALQTPAALPKTDIAPPIQQVVAMTPQTSQIKEPGNTVPGSLNTGDGSREINDMVTGSPKEEPKDSVLDKPFSLDGKSENAGKKLSRPKWGGSIASLVSVVGSLLIVLSVFFVLVYLMRKVSPKGCRNLPKEAFENLGRTQLTQKIQLHLLRLGNRLILVSITADGVQPLTEITDPDEVVPLLGLCRQLDKNSSTEVFRQTLAKFSTDESEEEGREKKEERFGRKTNGGRSPLSPNSSKPALVDLYSDPDASLAEILAKGLGRG